jgi:Na+/melibiose symporter-like transporter
VTERNLKVSVKNKIAFSTGALEEAAVGAASVVTMVFYNQVLGVSAYLCGIVFLIASVIDAVTDPLIGSLSDNFRLHWGRRHPFMLVALMPLGLGFYLLYAPPGGMSETFYFWWFLATMALLRIGKTFYAVPHDALGAELTDDYHERTSILGLNSVVGMIAGVLLAVFVLLVLFPTTEGYDNGLLNPQGYPAMALWGSAFICVTLLICVGGTRDQIPHLHDVPHQRINLRENLDDFLSLLKNRSYIAICMAWLVMVVSFGILGVVGTYTFLYGFDLTTEEMSIQRFVMIPGMFVALPLAAWFTRKLDKKRTVIYTSIVGAALVGLPHMLKMIGLFPPNDSVWMLPALFGSLFIGFLILPVSTMVFDSQLADVADEHEYRTGRRAEGIIFSIRTFAMKATGGLGGLIGGVGLEIIGFPEQATKEMLTPEMLNGLFFMTGPLYWIFVAVGMMFMGMYKLNENRHSEMMAELKVRRAAAAAVS